LKISTIGWQNLIESLKHIRSLKQNAAIFEIESNLEFFEKKTQESKTQWTEISVKDLKTWNFS
jgi:hypothetical protein